MPVYLSGCQTLLIMAGPTYCSRLWCVMEIFTFLFMGGKLDRIEIHALSASDDAPTAPVDGRRSLDDLKHQFATFDAAKAQCFLPKDKHRLLAVVEAGFGDFEEFNVKVRTAFAERLQAPPKRRALRMVRALSKKWAQPRFRSCALTVVAAQAGAKTAEPAAEAHREAV